MGGTSGHGTGRDRIWASGDDVVQGNGCSSGAGLEGNLLGARKHGVDPGTTAQLELAQACSSGYSRKWKPVACLHHYES